MKPLFFTPRNDILGAGIARCLQADVGILDLRHFPDGESYIRVLSDPSGRDVVICQSLQQPDHQVLPLLLLADTLRDLGAASIGLIAPYLSYMRQDTRFKPGEGITSRYFAAMLSRHFDWLATVDPHLHRYGSLDEIYRIPTRVIPAMPDIARWISQNIDSPLVIGPDSESEQWVSCVAAAVGCPYRVLEKERLGDRDVQIRVPPAAGLERHTPVLVDDIISSGHTMMVTARNLVAAGFSPPVCIGVHAVFSAGAYEEMQQAPIDWVVSCDTIEHPSNRIDLAESIAASLLESGFLQSS